MQQVLFTIPIKNSWFPDGIPIHGFGVMLFVCFIVGTWFAARRAKAIGFPPERMQDLGIILFVSGIVGARALYIMQDPAGSWAKFFNIWEGGIVFYGSAVGGFIGYWIFYYFVMRRLGISTWKLADVLAVTLALGLALGRIGCFLNGCCYGQVAADACPSVAFPLLTAPCREVLVDGKGFQTATGFTVKSASREDVRSVVAHVEKGSNAERAGLLPGDKILQVNGKANGAVLLLVADADKADSVADWFRGKEFAVSFFEVDRSSEKGLKVVIPEVARLNEIRIEAQTALKIPLSSLEIDAFRDLLSKWPKGRHDLELIVERAGVKITEPVSFTPRSLGLHPTQLYESISMVLLVFLLLAFHPLRRHDGQVFVLLMVCYALHRFINEILRNDTPLKGFEMTLSQNGSVILLAAALILELWLRRTQVNRWKTPPTETAPVPTP